VIDHPNLRTMIDCSAAGSTETMAVPELIDRWLPTGLIAHIQVNDPNRRAPGQGEMRFAPIWPRSSAIATPAVVSVEPFDYVPDGVGSAAFAIAYLRGVPKHSARRPPERPIAFDIDRTPLHRNPQPPETHDGHTNPRLDHARRDRSHGHEPAPDPLDRRDPPARWRHAVERRPGDARTRS
jgi:hypothetical protein